MKKKENGTALVEFALVLPLLLILTFITTEFSRALYQYNTLTKSVNAVTGRTPVLSTTGGTSDARFIKDYCPVVEFGLVGKTMHMVDERVALSDLETLTQVYERFIADYFG